MRKHYLVSFAEPLPSELKSYSPCLKSGGGRVVVVVGFDVLVAHWFFFSLSLNEKQRQKTTHTHTHTHRHTHTHTHTHTHLDI